MNRLRLVDIAAHCGVSKAAVSRALNRPVERSELRPETWMRIREAARALGYRADWRGRALAGGRSHTIGLLYDGIYPPLHGLPGRLVAECARSLAEHGYDLLLIPTNADGWQAKLQDRRCDAAIVVGRPPSALEAATTIPVPLIAINAATRHALAQIVPDDEAGAALATQHLLDLGHRRIAYVGGGAGRHARHASDALREQGYRATMQGSDATVHIFAGVAAAEAALDDPSRRPSAMIAYHDGFAALLMQAAYRRGLRIPGDLSLVAFNDDPEGKALSPPLTTLALPMQAMARAAAARVIACLDGTTDDAPSIQRIAETLQVRGSSGSPL